MPQVVALHEIEVITPADDPTVNWPTGCFGTKILIDGQPVRGVTAISIAAPIDGVVEVSLKFIAKTVRWNPENKR